VDDRGVERVEVVDAFGDVEDNGEAVIPALQVRGFAAQEGVVEVAVVHEVVDEEETPAFGVGGEADGGHQRGGPEPGREEELVVELALSLLGGGVHELDGDGVAGEGAGEDGAEAAVAKARGEGIGGAAEEGVGERVRGSGVGVGGRGGAFTLAEAEAK